MLLIKFPSRSRPEKLIQVYQKYISLAQDLTRIKTIISLDSDDLTINPDLIQSLKDTHTNTQVIVGQPSGKIGAVNRDMEFAGDYDIILLASDDMIPEVQGYDQIIRDNMPNLDHVLWFNDGFQGNNLNTLCILGREYYNRFGYIYHPAYVSLFCDNEFMMVAQRLGCQTYIDQIIIRHTHPFIIKEAYDTLYAHNETFFAKDRDTFISRAFSGFK